MRVGEREGRGVTKGAADGPGGERGAKGEGVIGVVEGAKVHEAGVGEDGGGGDPGLVEGVRGVEAAEVAKGTAEGHAVKVGVEAIDEERDGVGGLGDQLADVLGELGGVIVGEDDEGAEGVAGVWDAQEVGEGE